eukprot:CCRYP_001928-RA/>CCRYP_001928-RA protein AED:0.04 eAED:0.04 QI:0/-1/0/1/-1/1/1/0/656
MIVAVATFLHHDASIVNVLRLLSREGGATHNRAHAYVHGWMDHRRKRPALTTHTPSAPQNCHCTFSKYNECRRTFESCQSRSLLERALHGRGGGDDDEGLHDGMASDEHERGNDSRNESNESNDAMQRLRQRWSSVPAVPSIAWPFDVDVTDADQTEESTRQQQQQQLRKERQNQTTKAIIIMDGFSPYHGQYLAQAAHHLYGAAVIHVLSDFMTRYLYQVEQQTDHLSSRLPDWNNVDEVQAWKNLLPSSLDICGIYCESDSGLDDAERLGVALGLFPRRHDGVNAARRNKFLMNRVVSEVGGLDVVKQMLCRTLEEAQDFARSLGVGEDSKEISTMVVVKPLRGVASDDVHLCTNLPSLRKAFAKIYHSPIFGSSTASKHEEVLVQEFATGTEYAVDVVCRDGEMRVAALWKYDKRAVNGAPFVYFATQLVGVVGEDGNTEGKEVEQAVCNYVFKALDALGIRWGMNHIECIAEKIAPGDDRPETIRVRLVEVNCRQHNTDFRPLTNAVIGYNALDMVLAAYLGDDSKQSSEDGKEHNHEHQYPMETDHLRLQWDGLPILPRTLAQGAIVHFVSFVEGKISRIRYDILTEMEELESVMDLEVYPQYLEVGNEIHKTVDIRTDTGWAHLINDDEESFQRDYERLVELMKDMFEVE